MKEVKSSVVSRIGYDAPSQKLHVEIGGGKTYTYHDVPQSAHDALMNAESIGKHFGVNIKGKYQVTKKD